MKHVTRFIFTVFANDRDLLVHPYLFLGEIHVYEYVYEYGAPLGEHIPAYPLEQWLG